MPHARHRYSGRAERSDVAYAMLQASNPAAWSIHEATYPVTGETQRDDVTYYPVPFNALAKEAFKDGALRKYLLNMIYVGVLARIARSSTKRRSKRRSARNSNSKPAAVATNMEAVRIGFAHAREHLTKRDPFALEAMSGHDRRFDVHGRQSRGGVRMHHGRLHGRRVVSDYAVVVAVRIVHCACRQAIVSTRKPGERNVAIVQAEDELAAIGMVLGAGWAGARAMTSTSGPGLSLMAEWAGYGYYAEVPGVIFDVQRAGPSTGLPTRTMQADVAFAYHLSHGDTKHIVLLPATVHEAYEICDGCVRSCRSLSNAGFRAFGSRSRHELVDDQAASVSREAVRSRKSARTQPI